MSRKLSDRRGRHDRFHQRARRQGYRARSAFKLQEIDDKLHLVGRGARVLDLGCNPGSWLQYAGERAGPSGALVGVDRTPMPEPLARCRQVVGDVYQVTPAELLGDLPAFDVVLSDMAPDTTGVRRLDQDRSETLFERALELAEATLAPGGAFVGKLFQGPAFQSLLARCRAAFQSVKIVKPTSSRTSSIEQYVVGIGFRGGAGGVPDGDPDEGR